MQDNPRRRLQPKDVYFKKLQKQIIQFMQQGQIVIFATDELQQYSSLASPNERIDLFQLIETNMQAYDNISGFNAASYCQQQFYLDLRIIESVCDKYQNLKDFEAKWCNIGDKGVDILIKSKLLSLQRLELSSNKLTKQAMKVLASFNFKQLSQIYLSHNKIGNAGVSYLIKADWPKIYNVHFFNCNTTIDAFKMIHKSTWPSIRIVCFEWNFLSWIYTASLKICIKVYYPCISMQSVPLQLCWGSKNLEDQSGSLTFIKFLK